MLRGMFLRVQRQIQIGQPQVLAGNGAHAGALHRKPAQQLRLGPHQFGVADGCRLHVLQVAQHHGARFLDVPRISAEGHAVFAARPRPLQLTVDRVDISRPYPQVAVQPGRETAAQNGVAQHQRVAVRAGDRQRQRLGHGNAFLQVAVIRHMRLGRRIRAYRRQVDRRRRTRGAPAAEGIGHRLARLFRRDVAQHDDRRQVRPHRRLVIGAHVVKAQPHHAVGRRLAQQGIAVRHDRLRDRPLEQVIRRVPPADDALRDLRAQHRERVGRECGMQQVFRQQPQALLEHRRQDPQREAWPGADRGGDVIGRFLERQPAARLGAMVEQAAHDGGDAFLARRLLHRGNLAHLAEHRDRVADMLGLDDQPQAVGQHADIGRFALVRHVRRRQRGGGPWRQRHRMIRRGGERLGPAEAGPGGRRDGLPRGQDRGHRMLGVEQLPGEPVHVGDRDSLVSVGDVIGRCGVAEGQRLRPVAGKAPYAVRLEADLRKLPPFRCLHQRLRHAVPDD